MEKENDRKNIELLVDMNFKHTMVVSGRHLNWIFSTYNKREYPIYELAWVSMALNFNVLSMSHCFLFVFLCAGVLVLQCTIDKLLSIFVSLCAGALVLQCTINKLLSSFCVLCAGGKNCKRWYFMMRSCNFVPTLASGSAVLYP